ncbi:hypothetical protein BD770DRAFT_442327 [Pilaira anomala]|nr:hypothetical protein BD770DRAFT_442327 [Pilaira anomala]
MNHNYTEKAKSINKPQSLRIACTEGEIHEVSLVDNGLYVDNRVGSLRLPGGTFDIDIARTLISRLFDVKEKPTDTST